ncbi:MAG: hypothetical protein HRU17_09920 [Polyangiaceae bacterium]|nr:hypothetical protein [Polyangiaceae bacterium]
MSRRAVIVFAAIVGLHSALCWVFVPGYFSPTPVLEAAFGEFALSLRGGLGQWLQEVSGAPIGATARGGADWLGALAYFCGDAWGVGGWRALNGLSAATHLAVPCVGFVAARGFGLGLRAALGTAAVWSHLWFFDSLIHHLWFVGREGFLRASLAVVLFIGMAAAYSRRPRRYLLVAFSLAALVALLSSPLSCVPAILVLVPLHNKSGVTLRPVAKGLMLAFAVVTAMMLGTGAGGRADLWSVRLAPVDFAWDSLDLLGADRSQEGPTRAWLRTLCFAGMLARSWAPATVPKISGLALPVCGLLLLAYGGEFLWSPSPGVGALLFPAVLLASVPACELMASVFKPELWTRGSPMIRGLLLAGVLVIVPRVVRTVMTFLPGLQADRVIRAPGDEKISAMVGLNEPQLRRRSHELVSPTLLQVRDWLRRHATGRVALAKGRLAQLIRLTTNLEVQTAEREPSSRSLPDFAVYREVYGAAAKLPSEVARFGEYRILRRAVGSSGK